LLTLSFSTRENRLWSASSSQFVARDTDAAVAAVSANSQCYVFAEGFNDRARYVNIASDTGTWSCWNPLPNPGSSDAGLAAATIGASVYLFAKGINDRQLYVRHTL
jgi:hypothetical protein